MNNYELKNDVLTPTKKFAKLGEISIDHKNKSHQIYFIGICGGPSSGKTQMAELLKEKIETKEPTSKAHIIEEKDFFKSKVNINKVAKDEKYRNIDNIISKEDEYPIERKKLLIQLSCPECYDYKKFLEALTDLKDGKQIKLKKFCDDKGKMNENFQTIKPKEIKYIIVLGQFIFHSKEIRDFFNVKIFAEAENDVRLGRLLLKEEKFLNQKVTAYQSFFKIYKDFIKTSYEDYTAFCKKDANFIIQNYEFNDDDESKYNEKFIWLVETITSLHDEKKNITDSIKESNYSAVMNNDVSIETSKKNNKVEKEDEDYNDLKA